MLKLSQFHCVARFISIVPSTVIVDAAYMLYIHCRGRDSVCFVRTVRLPPEQRSVARASTPHEADQ